MARRKALHTSRPFRSIVTAVVCGVVITLSGWTADSSQARDNIQSKEKQIERGNLIYASDPLKITEIKVANKLVKLNEKFEGNEDWLKGANFKLKNISNRKIVHVQLDFDFPETAVDGPLLGYQLMLGHRPGAYDPLAAPLSLAPGATLDVSIDEKVYADFGRLLDVRPLNHAISRVKVRIAFVVFDDGTGYGIGGTFYRQDTNNPTRYLPITSNP
jgi:hypothetical protein